MKFFFWKKKVENSKRIFLSEFYTTEFYNIYLSLEKKKNFIHSEILFH